MWKLTIEQTTEKKLSTGDRFNCTDRIVFEHESIQELLMSVSKLSSLYLIGETVYKIEKVVEK